MGGGAGGERWRASHGRWPKWAGGVPERQWEAVPMARAYSGGASGAWAAVEAQATAAVARGRWHEEEETTVVCGKGGSGGGGGRSEGGSEGSDDRGEGRRRGGGGRGEGRRRVAAAEAEAVARGRWHEKGQPAVMAG